MRRREDKKGEKNPPCGGDFSKCGAYSITKSLSLKVTAMI